MVADAERLYRVALASQPDHFEAAHNLGILLHQQGRNAEALEWLDASLRVAPGSAEALTNRGIVLVALGRHDAARASFEAAIAVNPDAAAAHFGCGNALLHLQQYDAAIASFGRAIELDPANIDALNNRGTALRGLARWDEALADIEGALAARPDFLPALLNKANALLGLERCSDAAAAYDRVIALAPKNVEALINLGYALQRLVRHEEAIAAYDRTIALLPYYASAHWNRSLSLLAIGDYAQGWREYEWRWQTRLLQPYKRDLPQPLWLGEEPLAGRTILLHAEQGFGDILQFCRYVPLIAAQTEVVLEVPGELVRLMTTLDEGGSIVAAGEPLPAFDLHCPLISLPLALHTTVETIPAAVPYLRADPALSALWRERLHGLRGCKVGVVWAGAARGEEAELLAIDGRRSLPLAALAPLGAVAGCALVSLQKGRPHDTPPPGLTLYDYTAELHDFADTAALIDNLDLVIGADTAVIHLAGALGKPVWLLNRFDSCWRWLVNRNDSPWYPTLRQFRQTVSGDWASVMDSVARALGEFVQQRPQRKRGR